MSINNENSFFRYPLIPKITVIAAGLIAGFIISRIFLVTFTVSDNSMQPALRKGETIYILRHTTPGPGDVVLIHSPVEPGRVLLKRVLAQGDDVVEIRDKIIYRNNRKVTFNWKTISADTRVFPMNFSLRDNLPAVRLERNMFFVLGDNLDHSFDSRSFGPVNKKAIIGKMVYKL